MASISEIKQRSANIKTTRQIIRALEMVSSAKLQKAKNRLEGIRPLYQEMKRNAENLKYCGEAGDHPFVRKRDVKNIGYVIMTSDKGLCGSYNNQITEAALTHMNRKKKEGKQEKLLVAGAAGNEFFARHDKNILHGFSHRLEANLYADSCRMGEVLSRLYLSGEADEVYVAYTRFDSILSHIPRVEKILPLPHEPGMLQNSGRMLYEPNVSSFLDHMVPLYLQTCLFAAASESTTCEHTARMINMQSADKNAEDVIRNLNRIYNRKRQAAITQELTEIIGGAKLLN